MDRFRTSLVAASVCGLFLAGCAGSNSTSQVGPTDFLGGLKHQQVGQVNYGYYRFGSGKPLVMVNAFGMTMANWTLPLLEALSKKYDVTVFDNRGMGNSVDTSADTLTIPAMADSTIELIDALGIVKPDVLGWSLGAETCFTMAVRHPDKINRVISVGGDVGSPATTPPTPAFEAVAFNPKATIDQACSVLFPPGHEVEIDRFLKGWKAMPADPINETGVVRQADAYALFSASTTVWDAVPTIQHQVLLITGAEDEGSPPINSETLAKRLPNAFLVEISNSGHAVLFQEQDRCVQIIDTFLSGGSGMNAKMEAIAKG